MGTEDLISLIPPDWLTLAMSWAPYVLAALAITTLVARIGEPAARWLHDYARGTAATWDDGPTLALLHACVWLLGVTTAILRFLPILGVLGGRSSPIGPIPRVTADDLRRSRARGLGPYRTPAPAEADRIDPPDGPGGALAVLLFAAAVSAATLASGCSSAATAGPAVIAARDLTCRGGRVVCRVVDRVCRGTGGPWVVPRSPEEIATDGASPLTRPEPESAGGEESGE